jgi:hypothetical protein
MNQKDCSALEALAKESCIAVEKLLIAALREQSWPRRLEKIREAAKEADRAQSHVVFASSLAKQLKGA